MKVYVPTFVILFGLQMQIEKGNCLEAVVGGKIPSGRSGVVAVYDKKDSIFLLGGYDGVTELDDVLKYTISTEEIEEFGKFPIQLGYGTGIYCKHGNIFYFGGFSNQTYLKEAWFLAAGERNAKKIADLPTFTVEHSSTYDDVEFVYIFGGQAAGIPTSSIIKFSTRYFTSEIVTPLPANLYGSSATWIGGSAYIFGGVRSSYFTKDIVQFNPDDNKSEYLQEQLLLDVITTTAVTAETNGYIIGGYPEFLKMHHLTKFDSLSHKVEQFNITNFPVILYATTAVYIPNKKSIYTFGGSDTSKLRDDIFVICIEELEN